MSSFSYMSFDPSKSFSELFPHAPSPSKIAHIKGFGSGLVYFKAQAGWLQKAKMQIVKKIKESGATTIVFDGDPLRDDSFTSLIPMILDQIDKSSVKHIVAFRRDDEKSIESFRKSWETLFWKHLRNNNKVTENGNTNSINRLLGVSVFLVPHEMHPSKELIRYIMNDADKKPLGGPQKWASLGLLGLETSKATRVYCLGGGETLAAEIDCYTNYILAERKKLDPKFKPNDLLSEHDDEDKDDIDNGNCQGSSTVVRFYLWDVLRCQKHNHNCWEQSSVALRHHLPPTVIIMSDIIDEGDDDLDDHNVPRKSKWKKS